MIAASAVPDAAGDKAGKRRQQLKWVLRMEVKHVAGDCRAVTGR